MKTNYKTILNLLMVMVASTLSVSMLQGQDAETEPATERAVMKNGKLFMVDEEGNEQELDISNARSFSIQQSTEIVEQNGERVQVTGGTATFVDANGEQTEIEFETEGDADIHEMTEELANNIDLLGIDMGIHIGDMGKPDIGGMGKPDEIRERIRAHINDLQGQMQPRWRGPQAIQMNIGEMGNYILGVQCTKVGEALRGHLQLDESGLIIQAISPDSPATEAGLEKNDILLFADDQSLGTLEELTSAVDLAGEEDRSLALTFIRGGKEQSAEITPAKRPAGQARGGNPIFGLPRPVPGPFPRLEGPGFPRINIQQMGPGVILPDDMNPQMDEMLEQIRADMDQMRIEMKRISGDK